MISRTMRRNLGFAAGLLLRRPFSVLVQVTNRCNMTCSFCGFWPTALSPDAELSVAEYERIADELAALGCFLVSIEGGEPFLRPDLVDIVRAFGRRHVPVLYTNGWFVEREPAQALFAAGLMQAGVSIDYSEAQRHDAKRGRTGAFEKAWQAVAHLRAAAPHGGRQVHVMTVLMQDNQDDIEKLLQLSARHGVAHHITLLATSGDRRQKGPDALPEPSVVEELRRLRRRYRHFRVPRSYLQGVDAFLSGGLLPTCRAGLQSFNIDHVGNVAPCIERIGSAVGNVRTEPLGVLWARLRTLNAGAQCQDCWTLCRGFAQMLSGGRGLRRLADLAALMP